MDILSNKEIYVLLKILNDTKVKNRTITSIELDKHFEFYELKHLQAEINLAEHKTNDTILAINAIFVRAYGQEILTGHKITIIDFDAIFAYSHKYIKALVDDNLTDLSDINKLSTLLKDFHTNLTDKSGLSNFSFTELKYMPIILFAFINELLDLKSIANSKYRLTNRDFHANEEYFDAFPIKVQTFSFKISADITKLDEKLANQLNDFQNMFNKISQSDGIICSQCKTDTKQIQLSDNKNKVNSNKQRNHFSPTSQMLYDYIKEHAPLNGYIIESIEICPEQDEQYTNKMFNNKTNRNQAVARLNIEYKQIFNTDITLMKYDRLSNSYDISREITKF